MRDMHPSPAIFENAFDAYNFSIILNLFGSYKPYDAQSKMCEQNASYLAKHSELGSKFLNTICLKDIQKGLKQHLNFQKFSGGACPQTP